VVQYELIFLHYSDQRITQDVEKFSTAVSELYSSTFKPIVDIVLFTRRLVNSIGYGGPILMYFYYVLSGFVMRKLLPNFAKMTVKSQKLEGDFRFNHSRLLMHAEEIAFYRGWGIEKNLVRSSNSISDLFGVLIILIGQQELRCAI
jgi:ATP-binding cassette subfamily D (ALD) protein 3